MRLQLAHKNFKIHRFKMLKLPCTVTSRFSFTFSKAWPTGDLSLHLHKRFVFRRASSALRPVSTSFFIRFHALALFQTLVSFFSYFPILLIRSDVNWVLHDVQDVNPSGFVEPQGCFSLVLLSRNAHFTARFSAAMQNTREQMHGRLHCREKKTTKKNKHALYLD